MRYLFDNPFRDVAGLRDYLFVWRKPNEKRSPHPVKVLVTGAGGFIGSHVTELLLREGHYVRALVHYNGRGTWGHLKAVSDKLRARLEVQMGDITDAFLIRDLVRGCDTVLHLAALIGIPFSYVAPGVLYCDEH